jgi:hypothetical protein
METRETGTPEAIQPVGSSYSGDQVVSLGVTDDFAWYELTRMREQAEVLAGRMQNMEKILKRRSDEQQEYIVHLQRKLGALQAEINKLREVNHAA